MIKGLIILVTAVSLVSCAYPTAYHRKSQNYGYSESIISPASYQISFNGNEFTSRERVNDFALLRAAEVTLKNGFQYLTVVKIEPTVLYENVNIKRVQLKTVIHSKYRNNGIEMCRVDNNGVVEAIVMTDQMSSKHKTNLRQEYQETLLKFLQDDYILETLQVKTTIKFHNEDKPAMSDVYNAGNVIRKISKKYQLQL